MKLLMILQKKKKPDMNSTLSLREGTYAGYQQKAKKNPPKKRNKRKIK